MNPSAPTYIPRMDLPVGSSPSHYPEFLEILKNERNLLELRNDTETSGRLLREFEVIHGRLRHYECFSVLLDFDVIAHFASPPSSADSQAGLDALALDIFFIEGEMKYALPIGAYRELFGHLRHLGLVTDHVPKGVAENRTLTREEVVRELIGCLTRSTFEEDENIDELEAEVRKATWGTHGTLARLLSIFLSPRFDGLRSVYNTREKDGWYYVQEPHVRKWRKPDISTILEHDSMNLAIALSDFVAFARNGTRHYAREGFLLLSKTGALCNLLSNATKNPEMNQRFQAYFSGTLSEGLRDEFPVISPQRLALLEWFGGVSRPEEASRLHRLAVEYGQKCRTVHEDVRALISRRERSVTIDNFYKARERHLLQSFRALIRIASELRPMRDKRRMLSTVKDFSHRLIGNKPSTANKSNQGFEDEPFESEFLDGEATGVMEQIQLAIERRPNPTYKIRFERDAVPAARFMLFQEPSLRREVLSGMFCFDPLRVSGPLSYTMWWSVTTSDMELRSALAESLMLAPGSRVNSPVANPTRMSAIDPIENPFSREGVILETTKGAFGAELPSTSGDWKWLELGYLGRLLENSINLVPRIETIYINLPALKIAYEIWPKQGERFMTITSSLNLSTQIATLVYYSSHCLTDRSTLSGRLALLLNQFPKFTEADRVSP
ncbi:MAG: hypothetical protein JNN07_02985 [Verrucomicrobiales bacterium]|nr:hypothetical protein [Verrucomicrobiales bacterium]